MGWVWRDENDVNSSSKYGKSDSNNEDRCSTRKIMKSKCKTEEVEPGKFIRKCEKTEEIIKDCLGRPSEVVQSNKEYSEEDITDEVMNASFSSKSSELQPFNFPGLREDIAAIERDFLGGLSRFFGAAEELKSGFFGAIGSPNLYDRESSSSSTTRRGIPIESSPEKLPSPKSSDFDSGGIDLAGLARDV